MIKIAPATLKDKLLLKPFFRHYDPKTAANRLDCYLTHNHTIVAKDDHQIVGILQWHIKEDPNLGVAEFEEVFVAKNFRGSGIGSKLVEFGIKEIVKHFLSIHKKPRQIYLFVSQNNPGARHLYEKFGFKKIANLKNLFSDSENELFYSLKI